jgi:hypothetical protein
MRGATMAGLAGPGGRPEAARGRGCSDVKGVDGGMD